MDGDGRAGARPSRRGPSTGGPRSRAAVIGTTDAHERVPPADATGEGRTRRGASLPRGPSTGGPRSRAAVMGRADAQERVPPAWPFYGRAALLRGRNGGRRTRRGASLPADRVSGRTRRGASLPRGPSTGGPAALLRGRKGGDGRDGARPSRVREPQRADPRIWGFAINFLVTALPAWAEARRGTGAPPPSRRRANALRVPPGQCSPRC